MDKKSRVAVKYVNVMDRVPVSQQPNWAWINAAFAVFGAPVTIVRKIK